MNMEGRVQRTKPINPNIENARNDWAIIRAISEVAGVKLPYDNLGEVRARINEISPSGQISELEAPVTQPIEVVASKEEISGPIQPYFDNYFMTDPISRNSATMAKATKELPTARNSYL